MWNKKITLLLIATTGITEQNNGNTDCLRLALRPLSLCRHFSRFTDALVYAVMGGYKRYCIKVIDGLNFKPLMWLAQRQKGCLGSHFVHYSMRATFLVSKGPLCLYNIQNNTWSLVEMEYLFSSWALEENWLHIYACPCILYILLYVPVWFVFIYGNEEDARC